MDFPPYAGSRGSHARPAFYTARTVPAPRLVNCSRAVIVYSRQAEPIPAACAAHILLTFARLCRVCICCANASSETLTARHVQRGIACMSYGCCRGRPPGALLTRMFNRRAHTLKHSMQF